MIDLNLKTGRITARGLDNYAKSGYLPIFICRYMNPLVEKYYNTKLHFPDLSPSSKLLKDYKFDGNIDYSEFKSRYIEEVTSDNKLLKSLSRMYDLANDPGLNCLGLVMLCYCRDYTKCHRSILANLINSQEILTNKIVELYV